MGCIFFWSLYRPASLPAPVIVLIGLLLDLLGFSPLGLWAVLLVSLKGLTLLGRRRLLPLSFTLIWLVFCAAAAILSGIAWAVQSVLYLSMLPVLPLAAQIFTSSFLYPALSAFFIRAHRGAAAVELA
jgi:rod shape-determining protein MreD